MKQVNLYKAKLESLRRMLIFFISCIQCSITVACIHIDYGYGYGWGSQSIFVIDSRYRAFVVINSFEMWVWLSLADSYR